MGLSLNGAVTLCPRLEYHSVVLASCINILDSINRLPRKDAKKFINKHILSVKKNASYDKLVDGFQLLRSDLANVATREDVTRDVSLFIGQNAIGYRPPIC